MKSLTPFPAPIHLLPLHLPVSTPVILPLFLLVHPSKFFVLILFFLILFFVYPTLFVIKRYHAVKLLCILLLETFPLLVPGDHSHSFSEWYNIILYECAVLICPLLMDKGIVSSLLLL